MLAAAKLPARVMVDCSHAQTSKDYTKQPAVLRALIEQIGAGNRSIMGVMLESNIEAGNQKLSKTAAHLNTASQSPTHASTGPLPNDVCWKRRRCWPVGHHKRRPYTTDQ